jgi:hypothetical protein
VAPIFRCAPRPRAATPSHGDGKPRMVEREQKKGAQRFLVQALELPPLFSALS